MEGWLVYVRVWLGERGGYHMVPNFLGFCAIVNCCFMAGT